MKKKFYIICIIFFSIGVIAAGYFLTKFKNAYIEFGDDITAKDFVRYGTSSNVKIDISNVKKSVGEYSVSLKYLFFNYNLKAIIRDTTPPELKVRDIYRPLNYNINVDDFVVSLNDNSETTVEVKEIPNINDYGDYKIIIIATDKYNNKTEKESVLSIGWAKKEFSVEVGNKIEIEDLLFDTINKNTIVQKELDKINDEREGIYYLKSTLDNNEMTIKIEKTKDVTPPELVLKNVTIYENRKINSANDFIKKATDKGSEVTTKLLTDIDYTKIGEQTIKIEASDIDGNKVVKETNLKIVKDNVGPKISGVSKLIVNKGTKIDYKKGVSSYDDNFGNCSFTVDSSNVDVSKYGNYYAIYTSSDGLGNKTTVKRVIAVNHDKTDTDNLVKKTASSISSDVESIRDYVRNNIQYSSNSGGTDPTWYGLTNRSGNCIVHAYAFDALLKAKGYTTKIIWTTDKTHYWNMVYLNGKWVHMDSTPSSRHNKYSIMNDEQRYEILQGRDWDRSLWPAAT